MVKTRSQVAVHNDNDNAQDINSPLNPQGPRGMLTRAGASGTNNPMVPLSDYEALRRENEENRRMLMEIMATFKEKNPKENVAPPQRALTESRGAAEKQKSPEVHPQGLEHRALHFRPQFREERHEFHVQEEGMFDPRREKEQYQEVVESTCKEVARAPARKMELDNQSIVSAKDMNDIQKIVEGILEQKKLVPAEEKQQEGAIPFTKEIMGKPLPPKFRMPQLPTFTGKEDPREHIQNYESIMLLHGWEDAIMCRAFSITLKDIARDWFYALKEASISCFNQLKKEFINTFIINSKRKKDATYLLSVRQREGESLKQYID